MVSKSQQAIGRIAAKHLLPYCTQVLTGFVRYGTEPGASITELREMMVARFGAELGPDFQSRLLPALRVLCTDGRMSTNGIMYKIGKPIPAIVKFNDEIEAAKMLLAKQVEASKKAKMLARKAKKARVVAPRLRV